jgi:hypothetical protein
MIIRLITLCALGLSILGCSTEQGVQTKTDFARILPDQLSGFNRTGPVKTFVADSLYNYIDGAADEFIAYGVIQVASAEYAKDQLIYSVDIYEFADPLGAFGIYSKRRLPDDRFIDIGSESLLGNGYLYYLKNRFYMTINTFNDRLPDYESLSSFAMAIDSLIPGTALMPGQLSVFPEKRLIQHSEQFWPHGLENFAAPESCYAADYDKDSERSTLFFAENRSQAEYETLIKVVQQQGRIFTHDAGVGKNSIYAVTDTYGKVLVGFSDGVIFGVINVSGDYWAKALCEALFENLGKTL